MVSPEGLERWAIQQYTSISPKTNFKMLNAFADKDENPELPGSDWDYTFSEQDGKTTVRITHLQRIACPDGEDDRNGL
jgi:hypothetical protein